MFTLKKTVLLLCAMVSVTSAAMAQAYPDHAVRLIVPFPPAGATDIAARVMGERLSSVWGCRRSSVRHRAGSRRARQA